MNQRANGSRFEVSATDGVSKMVFRFVEGASGDVDEVQRLGRIEAAKALRNIRWDRS